MKIKTLLAAAFILFALGATPSPAQNPYGIQEPSGAPQTSATYIAMLFYKMSNRLPDFTRWAEEDMGLDQPPGFTLLAERDARAQELRQTFDLLSHAEPVYAHRLVELPYYSLRHQGYFINSFTPQTFFAFRHRNENFALIPAKIENQQYVQVSENDAALLERELQAAGSRQVRAVLTLIPQYADANRPVRLENGDYWLLLADISFISFYTPDGARLLWENRPSAVSGPERSVIEDLYRR